MYVKVLDNTTATLKRGKGGRNSLFSAIRQGAPFNFVRNCSNQLRGVLFIVRAGSDIIKADFMHTKGTNFPTKMKIGIHLEELK